MVTGELQISTAERALDLVPALGPLALEFDLVPVPGLLAQELDRVPVLE